MNNLLVLLLDNPAEDNYLGYFEPTSWGMLEIDGATLTLDQLQRFHAGMETALSRNHGCYWTHSEGNAQLSFVAEWVLRLGDTARFCDRAYIEEVARFIGQYLDRHVVTEASASLSLRQLRDRWHKGDLVD